MVRPEEFGQLLTEAIYYIKVEEDNKNIGIIQDELGYALARSGGSSIEYWRGGNVPAKYEDVENLARELVKRCSDKLNREWLEKFLESAGYPDNEEFIDELFPVEKPVEQETHSLSKIDGIDTEGLAVIPIPTEQNRNRFVEQLIKLKWHLWAALLLILIAQGALIYLLNNLASPLVLDATSPALLQTKDSLQNWNY